MMDVSPGLMDGDRYDVEIGLEPGSHVVLTNQSFTKVHPSVHIGAATNYRLRIGPGAILEYMPEPTIPYAGSRLDAFTQFKLSEGASLLCADITTPGRTHRGEQFQYSRLSAVTEILRGGQLVGYDHIQLIPSVHRFLSIGAFEHYTHHGVFWIFSGQADDRLLEQIRAALPPQPSDSLLCGASLAAEQGIIVRMLGRSAWELQAVCSDIWAICRGHLWGYPPCNLRK